MMRPAVMRVTCRFRGETTRFRTSGVILSLRRFTERNLLIMAVIAGEVAFSHSFSFPLFKDIFSFFMRKLLGN